MAASTSLDGAKRRLVILAAVLVFWTAAIVVRLVYLQIGEYGELTRRAQRQQQRTVDVAPRRGIIYDRNGHELAMSINVDSVFAVPSEVPDHANAAQLIAGVLKTDPQEILTRLKSSRSFAWIARKVDGDDSARIRSLKLKGVYFQKESKRFYPKRELAAHVLGYVGIDDEGLAGLESVFDEKLRGRPGKMLVNVDAKRRWLGRVERRPEPGESLVLTVDEKIQYIVERELDVAMQETGAEAATVIVQNPRTGEILALANRPVFNPNALGRVRPEMMKNRAVSDIYEPGSTFKVVLFSGALEEGLTRPDEVIDCQNGSMMVGNIAVRDYKPFPAMPLEKVIANSSGIGAIKIGLRLGDERYDRYIHSFGFGSPTGIELPGETRGMTKPASRWSKMSIIGMSRGYEVGVSALQMVTMASTVANQGVYVPPRIVAGVTRPSSQPQTVTFTPAGERRVVSARTAVQMKKMMESVVLFGTGRKAILDGYTSAGKTGTAQKLDPTTGAYHPWKHVASFVGFAPVREPAISVVVVIDSAKGGRHQGGQIAAPVFRRIAQQVLAYLNVPHDVELPAERQQLLLRLAKAKDEDLIESTPESEPKALPADMAAGMEVAADVQPVQSAAKLTQVAAKKTKPDTTMPPPPQPAAEMPAKLAGTAVVEVGGGIEVPTMLGQPLRRVIEIAQERGFELDVVGSGGVARDQSPAPGTRVAPGSRVAVRFAR